MEPEIWADYQSITLDGLYVRKWLLKRDCFGDLEYQKTSIYGKILKQVGDMVYAIILTYDYENQGIMKLNMNIDKFRGLYYPCPEIKGEFDNMYNKVKLNLKEVIRDYDTSN